MPDARVTLVTGFPNHRASQLVSHLLTTDPGEVWTVVSERDAPAAERYRAALPEALGRRFHHLVGDPAAIDMGLSGAEYRALSRSLHCIQHLAQRTGPTFGKESFEALNVGGMREALELGLAAPRLQALVAHSSLAVSGDRQGSVSEGELVAGQRFPGPGPATLARAELMVQRRIGRLPIVILRSGQVIGPSTTGAVDALEGVYLLILLILNAPQDLSALLPDWGDAPLHVVPADHFVRAADAVSRLQAAVGQTLHLTDPHPMTVRQAFNRCMKLRGRLASEGLAFPSAAAALRRDSVLRDSLQSILWRPRTFINMSFRKVHYATEVADRILGQVGLACPPLESYFEQLVRHVVRAVSAAPAKSTAS